MCVLWIFVIMVVALFIGYGILRKNLPSYMKVKPFRLSATGSPNALPGLKAPTSATSNDQAMF